VASSAKVAHISKLYSVRATHSLRLMSWNTEQGKDETQKSAHPNGSWSLPFFVGGSLAANSL
jgi:hypothetical protein